MASPVDRAPRRRRLRWPALVGLLLLVVPILEVVVIIAVGRAIGGWQTFFLLLLESALGAWLVRREGARAWTALSGALRSGQMPGHELADAALVLVGGTLLLTPGFVTDVVGFFFILPFTRPIARRFLAAVVAQRLLSGVTGFGTGTGTGSSHPGGTAPGPKGTSRRTDEPGDPDVIEGEVL